MKQLALVFLLLSASSWNLLAEEAAKAKFEKQDKALNVIYGELKKELEPLLFAIVQQEQRDWVESRDLMSEWQKGDKETSDEEAQLEMATDLTESRVRWLKAWKSVGEHEGLEGCYYDSYGGYLTIIKEGEDFYFALEVVRGPTFHMGGIGGKLRVNGSSAWFETSENHEDRPTWLSFVPTKDGSGRVRIVGENTRYFHGARAYFDGSYLRMGEVSEEERAEVLSEEWKQ